MMDKEDLQAIAQLMDARLDAKLQPIHIQLEGVNKRLDTVDQRLDYLQGDVETLKVDVGALKEDVDVLKEDSAVTRNGVNTLLDWADDASIQNIPLFKKKSK